MPLDRYRQKRDFSKTPEPSGGKSRKKRKSAKKSKKPIFVVQKHDASRLHYDFRLEVDGVLASWAVPKGPSLDPKDKRLAVHVEDHPLEYANFEGVIPEGYGAGTVMVWDRGTWEPIAVDAAHARAAIEQGKLSFILHGQKLNGAWALARLRSRDDDGDNWLLIKKKDEWGRPGGAAIVEEEPNSAKTGRSLEEIAGATRPARWKSDRASKTKSKKKLRKKVRRHSALPKARSSKPTASSIPNARKAPMPRSFSPQLCTLVTQPPAGDDWLHEIKYDGYRFLARRNGEEVSLLSRNDKDWTHKFPPLVSAIRALPVTQTIIDGEAAIVDRNGRTSFQRLQNAIKKQDFDDLAFLAFDLVYLEGYDITRAPLLARKSALKLIVSSSRRSIIRYSDHIRGEGAAVYANACKLGLEGIVSKQADAPYVQARTRSWLKVKCSKRQEFIIIGWTPPSGSRKHFGSLFLAAYDRGKLVYTGKVGTGFSSEGLRDIKKRLDALARRDSPLDVVPSVAELRNANWVAPKLVCEVEFTEWTEDGRLRHPSFQGLREDKEAKNVHIEVPKSVSEVSENGSLMADSRRKSTSRAAQRKADEAEIAGVRLSNPGRILYPELKVTKLELAKYYEAISDHILPHIVNRPLSTVRCPTGRTGQCFFQKHLRETFADPVKPIKVREKDGTEDYISIDSLAGLITLVQFGVLEIHPWGATKRQLEKPDVLTFDLDPGEGVGFAALREGALLVRDVLISLELESFLKSTGGKGLHVVVPIKPEASWEEAKEFCGDIARGIAKQDPRKYIATMSKAKRRGLIYIDFLRNSRGATSIAPYSTRARAGAPVAAPLGWDELRSLKAAAPYDIHSIQQRLKPQRRDPWAGYAHKQKLTKSRLRAAASLHNT